MVAPTAWGQGSPLKARPLTVTTQNVVVFRWLVGIVIDVGTAPFGVGPSFNLTNALEKRSKLQAIRHRIDLQFGKEGSK